MKTCTLNLINFLAVTIIPIPGSQVYISFKAVHQCDRDSIIYHVTFIMILLAVRSLQHPTKVNNAVLTSG